AEPGRLGDADGFPHRGVASLQLMVADQLLLRQLHATVPRHDDEAAEQRAGGGAGVFQRVDDRWFVKCQSHAIHYLAVMVPPVSTGHAAPDSIAAVRRFAPVVADPPARLREEREAKPPPRTCSRDGIPF